MSYSLNGGVHGDLMSAVSLTEKDSAGRQGSQHSVHSPRNYLCNSYVKIEIMYKSRNTEFSIERFQ